MAVKTAIITGAAGFIGSHLCEHFLDQGWRVTGFDNFLTGSQRNIEHLRQQENFSFVECDVSDAIAIEGPVDLVFHFACPASPVHYLDHPIATMKVDSFGTFHTLEMAKSKGARYIFASTSEIYGDPEMHPQREEYWGNVNPVGPRSVYDEAKRFSEALVMAFHRQYGLDTRIARIFNTYGPRMQKDDGRVIPNFINQALRDKPITIYGDGSQTRSFCYVSDLVAAIDKLATLPDLSGHICNLGNPGEYTILELAQVIQKLLGCSSELVYKPLPTDDPKRRCPDISKAKKTLGWHPTVDLSTGLRETIAFFRTVS